MNNSNNLRVPCWCPQCENMMKGKSTSSFYDWGVCINCKIFFIEGREERWKSGWRPSLEDMILFKKTFEKEGSE